MRGKTCSARLRALSVGAVSVFGLALGCSPTYEQSNVDPGPSAAFDPQGPCQESLSHVVDLAIKATGGGPTDRQRADYMKRCVQADEPGPIRCVMRLRRLPKRPRGLVIMRPVWRCFKHARRRKRAKKR